MTYKKYIFTVCYFKKLAYDFGGVRYGHYLKCEDGFIRQKFKVKKKTLSCEHNLVIISILSSSFKTNKPQISASIWTILAKTEFLFSLLKETPCFSLLCFPWAETDNLIGTYRQIPSLLTPGGLGPQATLRKLSRNAPLVRVSYTWAIFCLFVIN